MADNSLLDLEDQRRLELTLKARESIITTLVGDGKPPTDQGDQIMLMQALDGMDRTIIQRAKLKSDDNASKSQEDIARMMGEMLLKFDPRKAKASSSSRANISDTLPVPDLVPGEQVIGLEVIPYGSVVDEM